jgi:inhibitor of KinA
MELTGRIAAVSAAAAEGPPPPPVVAALGDQGVLIRFGDEISPVVRQRVGAALRAFDGARLPWLVDCVPGYTTLLIRYDDALASSADVQRVARAIAAAAVGGTGGSDGTDGGDGGRRLEIPVWYDPEVAPDLEAVAAERGMSVGDVVALHSAPEYLVYLLGFRPGFPFMAAIDPRLEVPRLPTPRPEVAPGSVAIAGRQTAIYPSRSPGGWRILGRTPLSIFDPARGDDPFTLHPGDRVRFVPVDGATYKAELGRAR